jgi:predicted outer membrane repeat protein
MQRFQLKVVPSKIENNTNLGGVLFLSTGSEYEDNGSTYTHNAANNGGAMFFERGTITLTGTIFTENYSRSGGAFEMTSTSVSNSITNAQFTSNYATLQGGAISVISSSTLVLNSGTFTSNQSKDSSAIYTLGTTGTNKILSATFTSNIATSGRTISLLFADGEVTTCTFLNNYALKETMGIFITFSTVTISDSTFNNTSFYNGTTTIQKAAQQQKLTGGFISVSVSVTMTITNCTFRKGFGYYGGAVYMYGTSSMTIRDSTFINNYSTDGGGSILATNFDTMTLDNLTFRLGGSKQEGVYVGAESGIAVSIWVHDCLYRLLLDALLLELPLRVQYI